jgi:LacI family transcriptional regulator
VPCFALLNDFAQGVRQSYVGLNNLKVGRIAAHMIATAVHRPGKTAVFVGGYRWHGHALRETGFRSYVREYRAAVHGARHAREPRDAAADLRGDARSAVAPPGPAGHLLRGRRHGGRHRRAARGAGAGRGRRLSSTRSRPKAGRRWPIVTSRWSSRRRLNGSAGISSDLMVSAASRRTPPLPGQHFLRPDLYLPESV